MKVAFGITAIVLAIALVIVRCARENSQNIKIRPWEDE